VLNDLLFFVVEYLKIIFIQPLDNTIHLIGDRDGYQNEIYVGDECSTMGVDARVGACYAKAHPWFQMDLIRMRLSQQLAREKS
jgi:hypothetical protein